MTRSLYCASLFQEATGAFAAFDLLVDISFCLDVVLSFFVGFHNQAGVYENQPRAIAIHYLKGWFTLDLLSSVPFDLIVRSALSGSGLRSIKLLRILRLIRLLKLLRLVRLSRLAVQVTPLRM